MRRLRLGRFAMPALLVPVAGSLFAVASAYAADPLPDTAAPLPSASAATPTPAPATPEPVAAPRTTPPSDDMEPEASAPPPHASGKVEEEWAARRRAAHELPSAEGTNGLLHTASAMTGPVGTFRVSFLTDWFRQSGFLCTASYPCVRGNNPPTTQDDHSHIGATLTASATLFEGFEAFLAMRAYANSNDQSRPNLLQVLGDTAFGLTYARRLGDSLLHIGGGADLLLMNGTGGVGLSSAGTSLRLRAATTFAFDETQAKTPLRIHVSFAYLFDNSGHLVDDVETARKAQISRLERYGLGINKVDSFEVGLGIEGLLADDKVRPFLEYTAKIPTNRQKYVCGQPVTLAGGGRSDECLAQQGFGAIPSKLSLGARYFPFADGGFHGLSFLGAVDIGLTGTSTFIAETAPQAPYTVWLGLALSTDTVEKPPVVVERVVETKVEVATGPTYIAIKGFVHEQGTNTPIPNAIVAYAGISRPPVASHTDGMFGDEVPPGTYQFTVKADGYKDATCGGTAVAPPKKDDAPKKKRRGVVEPPAPPPTLASKGVLEVDCALEPLAKVGTAILVITDSNTASPMPNVQVTVKDPTGGERMVTSDSEGKVKLDGVPAGAWNVTVNTPGYLIAHEAFVVEARDTNTDKILVRPQPKEKDRLVIVDKGEVKLKEQILFAFDRADILPESSPLLEEIADVIIRTPRLHRIQIQGHTDNQGSAEHNQSLSEQRAEAVRLYLVRAGVDPTRLEMKGFGDTKPIGANATEAGRKKNRRVQFFILDQDPEPKKAK